MSTPDDSNSCLVCREECQYYGIGECNHTVCAKCAIRLKVICKVAECPICRHKSSQILITKSHSKYNCFQMDKFMSLPDEDLLFENQEVLTYYTDLISYTCSDCGLQCNSMSALKRHVNNDHKKRFCLICVEHLKLFPREHELFDDGSLSEHKRWRAERPNHGHPKCQICQESFYDAELWYNHLRRQHFMCHICENLPTLERFHQQRTVYGNYEQLNKHFIASHYVCQEGPCQSDQFTNVFATENELRAHKISHHSGVMDKALLRETRRLDVDIRYQRRGASGVNSGPSGSRGGGGGSGSGVGPPATSHMPTAREALDQLVSLAPGVREFAANALAQSAAAQRELDANGYAENPEEFPTLTGETQTKFVGRQAAKATEEDFPSLPSASSTAPAATEASSQQQQQQQQVPPPPVYSGPRRMPAAIPFTSLVSGNNAPPSSAANLEEEYPTLGRPVGSASAASNSIWGPPSATSSSSASKPNISSNANKKVKKPPPSTSSANDFPSLPQPSGPPPQPSAVAKPTPKPRTRPPTAPPQPQKPTAAPEASKQQQQPPPPPPDPVEYRPAPNLRYQQLGSGGGGAASVALQPDEPTVYRPMNSIACVSFDSLHQQQPAQQKKQEKFSLVEDFPGLPAPASSAPIAARNNNTTKSSNSAKNRFAALNDSSPIDLVGDGDDWSEWPAAVSQQKQQQQQQQKSLNFKQKSTAGAVFSGQMDDFPTLGGPSSSSGASAAPVWRKDGRSQPKQQQQQEKYFAPSTPLGLSASAQSVAGGKKQKKKQQKQQQEKKQLELQSDSTASQQQQQQQQPPPRNASWCDLLVREQYTYSPPEGLLQRQGQLLERLQACLADQEKFTSFAKASSEYLQGQLEPEQFLSKAVNLLGGKQWRLIAADLISTLPSISRQRDLRKRLPDELRSALAVCDTCAQTLLPEDLDGHRCMKIEE